jgi:hypothetical protein
MRPARRFSREPEREPAESGALMAAMDRLREELEPGELRDLLEKRRQSR